jgi:hypothetical protein
MPGNPHGPSATRRLQRRLATGAHARTVAAELMAAMLACEDALDALAYAGHIPDPGPCRDRVNAARAHISHARRIAVESGIFKPAGTIGSVKP